MVQQNVKVVSVYRRSTGVILSETALTLVMKMVVVRDTL